MREGENFGFFTLLHKYFWLKLENEDPKLISSCVQMLLGFLFARWFVFVLSFESCWQFFLKSEFLV